MCLKPLPPSSNRWSSLRRVHLNRAFAHAVDMVTVFNNWSTVFSLASKAQTGDVTVVTIPDPKERDDSKQ